MTLDLTKPVQFRLGKSVEYLATMTDGRLVFEYHYRHNGRMVYDHLARHPSGKIFPDGLDLWYDIINVPSKPVTRWIVVGKDKNVFASKEDAETNQASSQSQGNIIVPIELPEDFGVLCPRGLYPW